MIEKRAVRIAAGWLLVRMLESRCDLNRFGKRDKTFARPIIQGLFCPGRNRLTLGHKFFICGNNFARGVGPIASSLK